MKIGKLKCCFSVLTIFVLSFISIAANAQETILTIDFQNTNDFSIVTEFIQECDLPNSPQNDGDFGVVNGRFEIRDSEGSCCPNALSQGLQNNFVIFTGSAITQRYCEVSIDLDHGTEGVNFACSSDPCNTFSHQLPAATGCRSARATAFHAGTCAGQRDRRGCRYGRKSPGTGCPGRRRPARAR